MTVAPATEGADWQVHDLREAVALGLQRGQHLLTEGEVQLAHRILDLEGNPARVYARLLSRKPLAFPVDELTIPGVVDPVETLPSLTQGGLVDGLVPWSWRIDLLPARRLADGCRQLALPTGGSRTHLATRLEHRTGWGPRWVRPRHRGLVRRLQRWAALSAWPRPEAAVLERMGQTIWPTYELTSGPALHRDRGALTRWEALHEALGAETLNPSEALRALTSDEGAGPGRLSLRRTLRRALQAHARQLERADPAAAVNLYEQLTPWVPAGAVAFRHARALEACQRGDEALELLRVARELASEEERPAIVRAAKRLARARKWGLPPDPPLRRPRGREVLLAYARSENRPLWCAAEGADEQPVEDALVAMLALHHRAAAHVEGRLFRSIYALLLADLYFLPVPGQLPVHRLAGPLDLGTPQFRMRRSEAVQEVLDAVAAGEAPQRVARALERWAPVRLAGWHGLDADLVLRTTNAVPPQALACIVEWLIDHRSTGLPDLVVLPGPEVRLSAHPSKLGGGLLLVEVKGPGDTLSDRQRAWHDRLLAWGLPVELWDVRPTPTQ